jgi:aminopeptidase N
MTEDVITYFNQASGKNLTPIFDQYLRHAALPVLELKFDSPGSVSYRWVADEKGFNMPVKVGEPGKWQTIQPTREWKTLKTTLSRDAFQANTDLFYVDVKKL